MEFGETHNLLAPEQYAGRKHRLASLPHLTKDLLETSGTNIESWGHSAPMTQNHVLTKLHIQLQYFVFKEWAYPILPQNLLQMASHNVRTAYGDSWKKYGPFPAKPIQGFGQGNGMGPQIWAAVSSVLIAMMQKAGFGFSFISALSSMFIGLYVMPLLMTLIRYTLFLSPDKTGKELLPEMQDCIDHWNSGLQATSGPLAPAKSYLYFIDFSWNGKQ